MVLGRTEHSLGAERTVSQWVASSWHWSSDDIAPRERVSQWHDVHAKAIARRTIITEAEDFGRVEVDLVRLGTGPRKVGLQRMRIQDASEARRTTQLLQDGNDDLILHLQTCGTRVVEQLGRSALASAGGGVFSANGEPSTIKLTGAADFVSIAFPRAAFGALVPHAEDAAARGIPLDHPTLRLLHAFLGGIDFSAVAADPRLGNLLFEHLLDLGAHLAHALGPSIAVNANGGLAAARLAAIKSDIRSGLKGDLSVEALAGRHGISTRYLHKLFERDGATFSRYVQNLRLEALRRTLVDPRNRSRTIAELIYAAGFNDISTCNRAFKARYGVSPGAARETRRP